MYNTSRRKFLRVRRGCQAFQRKGLTSGEVRGTSGKSGELPGSSEGKNVYTKGVFSSENQSASTGKKQVWCITKKLVFKGKEGNNIYTKEPPRRLWGSPSRCIGV